MHTMDLMAGKNVVLGVVATTRPKQWVKNVLVAAVPVLGGMGTEPDRWWLIVAGVMSFCLIAAGAYILNDIVDVERDRSHPRKRLRPLAAGVVSVRSAAWVGVACWVGGAVLGWVCGWRFLVVAGIYAAHTVAYSLRLKHVATVEIVALASGFVLRTAAGAALVPTDISMWFLLCVGGGALLMASGKRTAELMYAPHSRPVLQHYTESYLSTIRSTAVTVGLLSYAMWVFEGELRGSLVGQISILPYMLAVFRYAQIAAAGEGGEPEEFILRDRILHVAAVAWIAMAAAGMLL